MTPDIIEVCVFRVTFHFSNASSWILHPHTHAISVLSINNNNSIQISDKYAIHTVKLEMLFFFFFPFLLIFGLSHLSASSIYFYFILWTVIRYKDCGTRIPVYDNATFDRFFLHFVCCQPLHSIRRRSYTRQRTNVKICFLTRFIIW